MWRQRTPTPPFIFRDDSRAGVVVLAAALLLAGCPKGQAPEAEAPAVAAASVESAAAGVRVAALPTVFELAANDAAGLALTAPALPGPSRVTVSLSAEYERGLNIVGAVQQALDDFAARPGGRPLGQTQLMAPIGLTYMARGRYEVDGSHVEELRAMLAHPWGNRLLTVSYLYPAGDDTSERGAQLIELLGELEALGKPLE